MKNTTFEHTLKTLTNGVEIEVNQHQFNRVMESRAHQKKRKKFLWWFGATAVVFFMATLGYTHFKPIEPNKQALIEPNKQQNTAVIQQHTAIQNSITTRFKDKQILEQQNQQLNQSAKISTPSDPTHPLHSENSVMDIVKTKYKAHVNQPQTKINGVVIAETNSTSNQLVNLPLPQWVKSPSIENQLKQKNRNLNPNDYALLSWNKPSAKKRAFNSVYLNATYFPFSAAKNTSSLLPEQKAKMVGLSEDADYAYAVNGGLIYNLSSNLQLVAGIGIHTLQFDKIRAVDIKVDSNFESLTSGLSYNNFEHVADLSFTWLDLPFAVRYNKPISNKLGGYFQAGLQYRYLLQHKSYVFTVDSNTLESYELKNNYSNNRINKHQLAVAIEAGLIYNITPKLALTLSLPYQQDLFSIYNKKYAERSPAKLLGVKAGIEINF